MQKNFDHALHEIAENPRGGDEFSGDGFMVRVSRVTYEGDDVSFLKESLKRKS